MSGNLDLNKIKMLTNLHDKMLESLVNEYR